MAGTFWPQEVFYLVGIIRLRMGLRANKKWGRIVRGHLARNLLRESGKGRMGELTLLLYAEAAI